MIPYKIGQAFLGKNGNSARIIASRQFGWIKPPFDIGDLGGGEGDDLIAGIVFEVHVEIVKIPAGGSHDDDFFYHLNDPFFVRDNQSSAPFLFT